MNVGDYVKITVLTLTVLPTPTVIDQITERYIEKITGTVVISE